MSAFTQIAAAVVTALLLPTPVAGGRVYRGRRGPLPAEHESMVVVPLGRSTGDSAGVSEGPTDWTTEIQVECHARGTDLVPVDDAVDALLSDVYARLAALALPALGVMHVVLDPEIEWDYLEADTLLASATLTLRIVHRTHGANFNPWS